MSARSRRNNAEAALLREQTLGLRAQRMAGFKEAAEEAADDGKPMSAMRQPTLREALTVRRANKRARRQGQG